MVSKRQNRVIKEEAIKMGVNLKFQNKPERL